MAFLGLLFVSLFVSAILMRWSNRRVLGIETTWAQAIVIVTARTGVATVAGFAVGYLIRLASDPGEAFAIQVVGLFAVAGFALWVYRAVLGKMSNQTIPVTGVAKTMAYEAVVVWSAIILISFIISCLMFL